ncbi:MAG: hypothetical protein IJO10_08265 [Clostridia bacterium]|nr:hypothetical protein [Clostridia bacterium]
MMLSQSPQHVPVNGFICRKPIFFRIPKSFLSLLGAARFGFLLDLQNKNVGWYIERIGNAPYGLKIRLLIAAFYHRQIDVGVYRAVICPQCGGS